MKPNESHGEIQRADPGARRRAAIVVVVAMGVGAVIILQFEELTRALDDSAAGNYDRAIGRLVALLKLVAGSMALTLFLFAVWLWRLSARVHAAGRFPPPGHVVVRDVRVLKGAAALRRARVGYAVSVLLLIGAVAVPVLIWRVIVSIGRAPSEYG